MWATPTRHVVTYLGWLRHSGVASHRSRAPSYLILDLQQFLSPEPSASQIEIIDGQRTHLAHTYESNIVAAGRSESGTGAHRRYLNISSCSDGIRVPIISVEMRA